MSPSSLGDLISVKQVHHSLIKRVSLQEMYVLYSSYIYVLKHLHNDKKPKPSAEISFVRAMILRPMHGML